MDMQIEPSRIRSERERRAWSQEHLAESSGLSLRTVQRVEKSGAASFETARALAAKELQPDYQACWRGLAKHFRNDRR